jgi:hypothetical protein
MKTRKSKYASIPKPFISMTDMLVSLNAGLLVIGILSAISPDDEKDWQRLQQEMIRIEADAAALQQRTQALQHRQQTLVKQDQEPETAPAKQNETPRPPSAKTIARN